MKRTNIPCYLFQVLVMIALTLFLFTPREVHSRDWGTGYGRHGQITLPGSSVQVGSFERAGRIRRLYGKAFSHGGTPEESARHFVEADAGLFGVEPSELVFGHTQPIMYNRDTSGYKFTGIYYTQEKDNIPVFRARLVLLVRNEADNPLVLGSADLRGLHGFEPTKAINRADPDLGISTAGRMFPELVNFTPPEQVIWAGVDEMQVDPALAYSFVGDNGYAPGDPFPERYRFVADAVTGEILYQEDLISATDVTGNVSGRATQGNGAEQCGEELAVPMPYARVNIGSTVSYADVNGDFVIPNSGSSQVTVESRLRGQWFRVYNQAGADALLSLDVTPPGPADFLHNETNADEYYRAQVNGYLQANVVRDYTLNYNPNYPGLGQTEFTVNVNINDNCNAYYDGSSINFYTSGGGCPNTAFSTVIHHEYGHHLVSMAGSGQGAYGEGMGDVMGVLITDDPGLAWGFYGNCNQPLRNADNNMQYPCSGEIHYCGTLLSGSVWSTRNELAATNPTTYRDIISSLAINAILLHTGSDIDPSITIDYLTLDDDNGNIYDGTPHYDEIAAGFGAHNMDAPELALLSFSFPDGLPEIIVPEGGTTLRVEVSGVTALPEPGTGMIYINDGSGWVRDSMTVVGQNVYDAVFPAVDCGLEVSYAFSAQTTDGRTQFWPMGAPDELFSTVSAFSYEVALADDFNTDLGWTVQDDPGLTSGSWERGIPVGGGDRGDPPTDYDGSGYCYLTDNRPGDSDIDGGATRLTSPTLDLHAGINARIHYALWYTNNYGNDPNNDLFKVYLSNDNGANWTLAETIGPVTTSGWKEHSFMVGDFVTPTNQVKVRFEASDLHAGSVVEAGVDDFSAEVFTCGPPDVSIQIIPDNPPVTVPQGGSFTYTGILTNNLNEPQTTDVWIMVTLPSGDTAGPVTLYDNLDLAPGQVLQIDNIRQDVPQNAPLGTYNYIAYAGYYPDVIVDQSSFEVTVTAPGAGLEEVH